MKIKAPIKLPAHDYITHLSVWISKLLNSEKIFPLSQGVAYPNDFEQYIKVRAGVCVCVRACMRAALRARVPACPCVWRCGVVRGVGGLDCKSAAWPVLSIGTRVDRIGGRLMCCFAVRRACACCTARSALRCATRSVAPMFTHSFVRPFVRSFGRSVGLATTR